MQDYVKISDEEFYKFIQETYYFDYNSLEFNKFFFQYYKPEKSNFENLILFYYIVRDKIEYNPYYFKTDKESYKASRIAKFKKTFCIPKAILFSTIARKLNFPSRIGFADVKNHLSSQRFLEYLGSDIFAFHGYSEIFIYNEKGEGKWVKATPAFDEKLCEKFNVKPLDFDGENDSIFQEYDQKGGKFMEYIRERGSFPDYPFEYVKRGLISIYPQLWRKKIKGDLKKEIYSNKDN